ncbi:peptidoglycan-binding protein [Cellulomonas sp. NPDC058312]|uniref:peptidoglycan-binding protein n=1 Tax=Cellulomonas sp. NPDC058312 TaxID=3346441 RepID=UPI0036F1417B
MSARTTRLSSAVVSAALVAATTGGLAAPATAAPAGPGDGSPADSVPADPVPADSVPADSVPADSVAADPVPAAGGPTASAVDEVDDVTGPGIVGTGSLVGTAWTQELAADEDVVGWWYAVDGAGRTMTTGDDARHARVVLDGLPVGLHLLTVWALDAAGNEGSATWTVEVPAPAPASPRVESSGSLSSETPSFTFRAVDRDVVAWTYELDGGPVTPFAAVDDGRAELRLPGLPVGPHTIQVTASTAAGGVTRLPFSFVVQAPAPAQDGPPVGWGGGVEDGAWVWGFGAEDEDVVRWTYAVDGGAVTRIPGADARRASLRLEGLAHGSHVLTVWAQNAAGEVTRIEDLFQVDVPGHGGPRIGSGGGLEPDGTWVWGYGVEDGSAPVATWEYSLDGSPRYGIADADAGRAELRLADLPPGRHVLSVWATDGAGASTVVVWAFDVDGGGPDTAAPQLVDTTRTLEAGAWTFRYVVDETVGRWAYRLDNGAETEFTGTDARSAVLRFGGLQPGPHDVVVSMSDLAGNTSTYRWVFDVAGAPDPGPTPGPVVPDPLTPRPTGPVTPTTPAPVPATPALRADAIPASRIARGVARGQSGPSVALIQRLLGVTADGRFGRQTAAAVRAFQRTHGLVADGIVGPLTWAALVDVANGGSGVSAITAASVPQALVLRGVRQGARGQAVATIQRLVGAPADGRFGPRTRAAVLAWQRAHGLVADGVVGRRTWAALASQR